MDLSLSILTGLGLRLFLHNQLLGNLSPVLLGLWEGVVVHQLSSRSSTPVDHYLAYGLRLTVDLFVSANITRLAMVVLWTALGVIVSESMTPGRTLRHAAKRERRQKKSTTLPSHIRVYHTPDPVQPHSSTPPFLPAQPPQSATPQHPAERPASPPSFFLHGGSEGFSPSPIPVQLQLIESPPTARPPSGLASFLEREAESGSPPSKPVHLATPPESAPSDGIELQNTPNRLSTIAEMPSREEITPPNPELVVEEVNVIQETRNGGTFYAPSATMTAVPIPVPNASIQYVQMRSKWHHDEDVDTAAPYSQPRTDHTLMHVPNATTRRMWESDSPTPFETRDELRTPGPSSPEWGPGVETDLDNDELQTPIADKHTVGELSPLVLDEQLKASEQGSSQQVSFGTIAARLTQATGLQAPASTEFTILQAPEVIPSALLRNDVAAEPAKESDAPDDDNVPDPDPGALSDPETLHTEGDESSILSSPAPTKLTRKAEKFREDAKNEEKERSRLDAEWRLALSESRITDALKLKGKLRESEARVLKLHQSAARRHYAARNIYAKQKPDTIDVHGLRPGEAIEKTESALRMALERGQGSLRVIVGKGLHSAGGRAILKAVVQREMERQKIPCRVDVRNTGVLILSLPP